MIASPLTTGLVITPGRVPGRVVPRMVHRPVTRLVVLAHSPPVTYSWRLKSPFGHVNIAVAVPLRDIATSNWWTPGAPAFEAGTVFDVLVDEPGCGMGAGFLRERSDYCWTPVRSTADAGREDRSAITYLMVTEETNISLEAP